MSTGDVENGKSRVDLSGLPRDFPTVDSTQQVDIGYKHAIFAFFSLYSGYRFFAGRRDSRFKTAITKSLFNDTLNRWIVFNNQDHKLVFQHSNTPYYPAPTRLRGSRGLVPAEMQESEPDYWGGLSSLENRYLQVSAAYRSFSACVAARMSRNSISAVRAIGAITSKASGGASAGCNEPLAAEDT